MKPLKILIVEDELITAELLRTTLEELGYDIGGVCISSEEALQLLRSDPPDLAILDITIQGDRDGIWLGKYLNENLQIPFIYLTSHGDLDTVHQAVETLPFGYLIKPFNNLELRAVIETALARFISEAGEHRFVERTGAALKARNSIFLKDEHRFTKVYFDDIVYIKSDRNYVEIYSVDRKSVIKAPLKDILNSLPQDKFFQPHRSYIVNLQRVTSFGSKELYLGGIQIPLGHKQHGVLIDLIQSGQVDI